MLRRDSTLVLLFTLLSGCSMPPGMNTDCEWPAGATNAVARSLVADVTVAEELAMRYADSNFESKASHGRLRSNCEAKLFTVVAQNHRVAVSDIEAAREQPEENTWDWAVHLPLLALYLVLAVTIAAQVPQRFASDEGFLRL